jgi:hypothetical protein
LTNKVFFNIDKQNFKENTFAGFNTIDLTNYFACPKPDSYYELTHENELIELLRTNDITSRNDHKLLSIIQTNLAHHLSFFLSELASSKFGGEMVVLNIDQHSDHQKITPKIKIGCYNWGSYSANSHHIYISAFNKTMDLTTGGYKPSCIIAENDQLRQNAFENNEALFSAITPFLNGRNIYLTIDLDVLKGKERTTFNEGLITMADLQQILRGLFSAYGARIIAVDICGLPPNRVDASKRDQYIAEANSLIAQVEQNLV